MSTTQPKEVTAELERAVWNLRMKCWNHFDIADKLRISEKEVARLLKHAAEKYIKAFQEQMQQVRAEHTGQLQQIAHLALNAWEQSQPEHNPPAPPQPKADGSEPDQNAQRPTPDAPQQKGTEERETPDAP